MAKTTITQNNIVFWMVLLAVVLWFTTPAIYGVPTITNNPNGSKTVVIDGKELLIPPGFNAEIIIDQRNITSGGETTETNEGTSKGVGVVSDSTEGTQDIETIPPELSIKNGIQGKGGGSHSLLEILHIKSGWDALTVIGGVAILAGVVVAIWLKQIALGISVSIGGLALVVTGVMIEQYPWILFITFIILLGCAGMVVWSIFKTKQRTEYLDEQRRVKKLTAANMVKALSALEKTNPAAFEAYKEHMRNTSAGNKVVVTNEIDKIKSQLKS